MPTKSRNSLFLALLTVSLLAGCASASYHRQEVQDDSGDKVTVGTVQKEIKKGMSGAEVAAALGSPNIVSTDEQGREVWIYDKITSKGASRIVEISSIGCYWGIIHIVGQALRSNASLPDFSTIRSGYYYI